jgi:hypothetical protein
VGSEWYTLQLGHTSTTDRSVRAHALVAEWTPIPAEASRRLAPVTNPQQAYYWAPAWQAAERAALEALARGDFEHCDSAESALAYLRGGDDEG